MPSGTTFRKPTLAAPRKENYLLSTILTIVAVVVALAILRIPPLPGTWAQNYDPFGHWWLSTLVAALPVIVLLGLLAGFKVKAHLCAIAGAATAILCAILVFHMPSQLAFSSFGYGAAYGLLKIVWIVIAAVFLYDISV